MCVCVCVYHFSILYVSICIKLSFHTIYTIRTQTKNKQKIWRVKIKPNRIDYSTKSSSLARPNKDSKKFIQLTWIEIANFTQIFNMQLRGCFRCSLSLFTLCFFLLLIDLREKCRMIWYFTWHLCNSQLHFIRKQTVPPCQCHQWMCTRVFVCLSVLYISSYLPSWYCLFGWLVGVDVCWICSSHQISNDRLIDTLYVYKLIKYEITDRFL